MTVTLTPPLNESARDRESVGSHANVQLDSLSQSSFINGISRENIMCMLEVKSEMNLKKRHLYQDVITQLTGPRHLSVTTKKELRQQQIKEYTDDYTSCSTLHGLSYVFDKRHSIRRVVWLFMTVAACGYALHKVYESTVNYLNYPFSTARMRKYVDELEFPAVSFCNLNDMKFSVLNGTKVDEAILDHTKMDQVTAEEYRNITLGAAHKIEEMLVSCTFNGQPCSAKNFTLFYWMQGDLCFTFNSGKSGHNVLSVSGTGIARGLQVILNIQHYEYYRDRMLAGVHLILHGQDETPVRIRGPVIPPGFTTYMQIEKKKVCFSFFYNVWHINVWLTSLLSTLILLDD